MKVVLFNGPPRCGKDTVSHMLVEHMEKQGVVSAIKEESLSLPLRRVAYALVDERGALDGDDYAQFKSSEFPMLGVDGRHLMIDVSEKFLKPAYGIEVMAKLLLERNWNFQGVLLVRDSGFQIEVDTIIREVGEENVYLVRVFRAGTDFFNDSRERVKLRRSSNQMDLWNNGTLDDLRAEAGRIYGRLVNQMGWRL